MTELSRKLTMAGSAVVLALAMAACSTSNDGRTTAATTPDTPPAAEEMPTAGEVAATEALAAYDTAKEEYAVALAAYTADPSVPTAYAAMVAANAAKDAANAAVTAAAGGSDEQKVTAVTVLAEAVAAVDAAMAASAAENKAVADADTADRAAADAQKVITDALAAYATAETGYDTAKTTYDGDMTLANAMALSTAATEMQMKAAAASAAAASGTAEEMAMAQAAVNAATAAVAEAGVVLAEATRASEDNALLAAADAISAYNLAKLAYDTAFTTYGTVPANVKDATGLVALAATASMKAAEAKATANLSGQAAQVAAANDAVANAEKAAMYAQYELTQATTTAAALPFEAEIKGIAMAMAPIDLAAMATRKTDDVAVTVTEGDPATTIAKGDAADIGNGWYRADVANTDGDVTATVFTNIENTMETFVAEHGGNRTGVYTVSDITGEVGVITLDNNGAAALDKYVASDGFPTSTDGALMWTYGGGANDEGPLMFAGTFDGVPGEYACEGDNCSATNEDGKLTALLGAWTFTPDYFGDDGERDADTVAAADRDDLTEPKVAVADPDYLRFGWWTKVDDKGGVEFQTFSGGTPEEAFTLVNINDQMEGTATYKGRAAGRYAVSTYNSNSTLDSVRHGVFTAAATLEASFGGTAIAVDDQFSINGEITGFTGENDDDLSAWSVIMMKISDLDDLTAGAPVFTGNMVGGGLGGSPVTMGGWNGQFFGNTVDAEDDPVATAHPLSVAGEFNAQSSHGAVAGAFGAENTK